MGRAWKINKSFTDDDDDDDDDTSHAVGILHEHVYIYKKISC